MSGRNRRSAAPVPASAPVTPVTRFWRAGLLVLAGAVLLAFWPALSGGFVWDDRDNLLTDATHYRGVSAANLAWCLTAYHGGHYQPLTWLSFMLDHALWGAAPRGFHLTNVLLHALNALLFAMLAQALVLRTRAGGAAIEASIAGIV